MVDCGEKELEVFCIVNNFLDAREGYFFIVSNGHEKIGFGCFAVGINDSEFRQLQYFAIKPEFRGCGLGRRALKTALQQEVNASSGCGVSCRVDLKSFYEELGFTTTLEEGENIAMSLSTAPLIEWNQAIRIPVINRDEINKNIPLIKAELGVHLAPL
jgi:GNAT superfamily N-acetyltransferase